MRAQIWSERGGNLAQLSRTRMLRLSFIPLKQDGITSRPSLPAAKGKIARRRQRSVRPSIWPSARQASSFSKNLSGPAPYMSEKKPRRFPAMPSEL